MKATGKAWKFGNDINTDEIIPARYLNVSDPNELAKHCMEDADPDFVKKISEGDIIVAGKKLWLRLIKRTRANCNKVGEDFLRYCGIIRAHILQKLSEYGTCDS